MSRITLDGKHMPDWDAADLMRVTDSVIMGMVKFHAKASRSTKGDLAAAQLPLVIAEARRRGLKGYLLDLLDPPLCALCKTRPGIQLVGRTFYCGRPLCRAAARLAAKQHHQRWSKRDAEANAIYSRTQVESDTRILSRAARREAFKNRPGRGR